MLGISTGVMGYNRTARRSQQIRWFYDSTDPTVITLKIPDFRGSWVEWTLPRDLFSDAFLHPVSLPSGDAQAWTASGRFAIQLCSQPDKYGVRRHHCIISFPAETVWEFITTARKLVPPCANSGQCAEDCLECALVSDILNAALSVLLPEQH